MSRKKRRARKAGGTSVPRFFAKSKGSKSKPEILKHGGTGGENRRKRRKFVMGLRASQKASPSAKILTQRHQFLISSVLFGFPSVPSVFQDFWF